ncbi:MAG: hypothetical protein CL581_12555 [Alteromonadaceae bacterium]|nr:hypothetical protein [Alteromonadaceae bacterium]MBH86217.1 hypothetical protein [Alteromonadaceae bacterium]|tara:strand:- start:21128 stop:21484 length:357 start_codon:yes stop_codon:yes gene_type:complete
MTGKICLIEEHGCHTGPDLPFAAGRRSYREKARPDADTSTFYDSEFADHVRMTEVLNMKAYFCDLYRFKQRKRNENSHGLLPQEFPEGTDFAKMSPRVHNQIVDEINNRPRKRLDTES